MPKRLHHIAIVVDDFDDAIGFLTNTLGLEVANITEAPEQRLKIGFLPCGEALIEVIESTDPDARRTRLGDATARIDHIAVQVDDAEAEFASLAAKGVEFTTPVPEMRGPNKVFFTKPESSDGVTYQFLEIGSS